MLRAFKSDLNSILTEIASGSVADSSLVQDRDHGAFIKAVSSRLDDILSDTQLFRLSRDNANIPKINWPFSIEHPANDGVGHDSNLLAIAMTGANMHQSNRSALWNQAKMAFSH